jgi:uncharacterized membrane protein (UPF0127 family)
VADFIAPHLEPDAAVQLHRLEDGAVIAARVECAFDRASRRRGLLGRNGLAPGTALVIAPCRAVHTWFMRFPIDVVFVSRDGRVVKVRGSLPAWRMTGTLGARAVVELMAGAAVAARIEPGDHLTLVAHHAP